MNFPETPGELFRDIWRDFRDQFRPYRLRRNRWKILGFVLIVGVGVALYLL